MGLFRWLKYSLFCGYTRITKINVSFNLKYNGEDAVLERISYKVDAPVYAKTGEWSYGDDERTAREWLLINKSDDLKKKLRELYDKHIASERLETESSIIRLENNIKKIYWNLDFVETNEISYTEFCEVDARKAKP